MSLVHTDVTIPNGVATTGVVDVTDRVLVSIYTPAAFDGTALTLQAASTLAGTYYDVFDAAGTQLVLTVAASRVTVVAPDATRGLRYIKLVSDAVAAGGDTTVQIGTIEDDRA